MDAEDRMANCLKVLASQSTSLTAFQHVWLDTCRHSFSGMIADKFSRSAAEIKKEVGYYSRHFQSVPSFFEHAQVDVPGFEQSHVGGLRIQKFARKMTARV